MEGEVQTENIKDISRRKTLKAMTAGAAALAAYNFLPAKWGSPVIETVFLPAHAATSGAIEEDPAPEYTGTTIGSASIGSGTSSNVSMTLLVENPGVVTFEVRCTHGALASNSPNTVTVVAGENVFTNFANSQWSESGNWTINVSHEDGSNDSITVAV